MSTETPSSLNSYLLGQHLLTHEQELPWCRRPVEREKKETQWDLNRHYRTLLAPVLASLISTVPAKEHGSKGMKELQGDTRLVRAISFEGLDMVWQRVNGNMQTPDAAREQFRNFLQLLLEKGAYYLFPGHPLYDKGKPVEQARPVVRTQSTTLRDQWQQLQNPLEPPLRVGSLTLEPDSNPGIVLANAMSSAHPTLRTIAMNPNEKKALGWLVQQDPKRYSLPEAADPPPGLIREFAREFRQKLSGKLRDHTASSSIEPEQDFRRKLVEDIVMEWEGQTVNTRFVTNLVDQAIRGAGYEDMNTIQKLDGPEFVKAVTAIMAPASHSPTEEARRIPALEHMVMDCLLDGSPERMKALKEIAKIWNGLVNKYNIPWCRRPRLGLVRIAVTAQSEPLYRRDRHPEELREEQRTGVQTHNSLEEQLYV